MGGAWLRATGCGWHLVEFDRYEESLASIIWPAAAGSKSILVGCGCNLEEFCPPNWDFFSLQTLCWLFSTTISPAWQANPVQRAHWLQQKPQRIYSFPREAPVYAAHANEHFSGFIVSHVQRALPFPLVL